jgi:hypothetical protein
MGKTRSAPPQTPRRRRIGNNPIPHGWNPMGRTHYAPAPCAAQRQRLRPQDPKQQRAATSGGILQQEKKEAENPGFPMAPLWQ